MPNEVIEQVHKLARAAEKYKGIVFTNMQGNILEDEIDEDDDNYDVMEDNTNNIHHANIEEQNTNQLEQDSDSTFSNERDDYELMGDSQVDIDHKTTDMGTPDDTTETV